MYYSMIGLLAILILLIVNQDVLFRNPEGHDIPALGSYRLFLFAVLAYYITDMLWGIFDALGLHTAIYIDTVIYFLVMAVAVLFWTRYVIRYLDEKSRFGQFLNYAGWIFLAFEVIAVLINFFFPILFWFEKDGTYHTGFARHITLGLQIVMFLLTAIFTILIARNKDKALGIRRYRTIGLFGLSMMVLILFQMAYPLLPLYSIGCMLGTCLLHTFVIEDEKEEFRRNLQESMEREKKQRIELGVARHKAYTDGLTKVKNKLAYAEFEEQIDERIANNSISDFAIAVFDVNDLKSINDFRGHDIGDKYIIAASKLICSQFKHSPVFRIGGDEFVAILEGEDFRNREELRVQFNETIEKNLTEGEVIVALGLSDFIPHQDNSFRRAFERADQKMYIQKQLLKNQKEALP